MTRVPISLYALVCEWLFNFNTNLKFNTCKILYIFFTQLENNNSVCMRHETFLVWGSSPSPLLPSPINGLFNTQTFFISKLKLTCSTKKKLYFFCRIAYYYIIKHNFYEVRLNKVRMMRKPSDLPVTNFSVQYSKIEGFYS